MNKMREYERGREDGLTLALRIVKQGESKPWSVRSASGGLLEYIPHWQPRTWIRPARR